jgi:hypothetical protein
MIATTSPIRGRGALSLRLGAQTLSRTGRGWVAPPSAFLRSAVRGQMLLCRSGMAQALGNSTSPGTGEVASLSEPERALSPGWLWSNQPPVLP